MTDPPTANPAAESSTEVSARQLAPVTAAYAAVTIWLAALGLVTTPYLLHHLGSSAYAVFALMNLIIAYLSNLEFGFGHGTVRFLARARAQGDRQAEARIIGTSLVVFAVASTLGGLIVLFGAPVIVKDFAHFPASIEDEAVDAVRIGALVIAATFLMNFFTAALQAHGRFPVLIKSRLVFGTLLSLGAVIATAVFADIRAVLVAQALVAVSFATVLFIALVRTSDVSLKPSFHGRTFKVMGAFSLVVLATGLATQAMLQGPPTVLAGDAPSGELAVFAVPALILQQLVTLVGAASIGFLPFASGQSAREDTAHLSAVFNSHVRLTLLTMGPIAGFLIVFAYPLLEAWVGGSFASDAANPLRLLAGAALLVALSAPPADVARGLGKPGWALGYVLSAAAIGIGISIPAVRDSGADGAALGLFLGVAITTPVFLFAVASALLHESLVRFVRSLSAPMACVLGATVIWGLANSINDGFVAAVVSGALVTAVYLAIVWRVVLSSHERGAFETGFSGLISNARALIRRRSPALRGRE
jgi:O-antigen/teichoic acid export membrane protein